jgi:DNA repair exonuclease SbcCD ATPase subunit
LGEREALEAEHQCPSD